MTDHDVIERPGMNDVLEIMTRAVFQAGVKWSQIGDRWEAYRRAFDGFSVERVARYGEADMQRVLEEPGVLRMPRKVKATIVNAIALEAIASGFGGFREYVRSFPTYAARAKDLKKRFAFMGDMNVWYVLFRCGEPVPRFESWVTTIPGDHPRMREMVERARATGRSPETDSAADG